MTLLPVVMIHLLALPSFPEVTILMLVATTHTREVMTLTLEAMIHTVEVTILMLVATTHTREVMIHTQEVTILMLVATTHTREVMTLMLEAMIQLFPRAAHTTAVRGTDISLRGVTTAIRLQITTATATSHSNQ